MVPTVTTSPCRPSGAQRLITHVSPPEPASAYIIMSMSSSLSAATLMRTGSTRRKSPIGNGVDCMKILVLNAGPSNQKSRLYEVTVALPEHAPQQLWQADAVWTHYKET